MRKIKVVYDLDGTLNNLNETVCRLAKAKYSDFTNYDLSKARFSKEQREQIMRLYTDYRVFQLLRLQPGAKDIFKIEESGIAQVIIHSLSYSSDIIAVKNSWLKRNLNKSEGIILELGKSKQSLQEIDIVVEDCLSNLLMYKGPVKKILIDKPYNQDNPFNDAQHGILRVSGLSHAVSVVNSIVAELSSVSSVS